MPRAAPGPTDRQEHVLERVTERAILRARDPTDSEAGEGRPRPKPPWRRSRTASESARRPWLRIPRRDRRTDRATPRAPPEERTADARAGRHGEPRRAPSGSRRVDESPRASSSCEAARARPDGPSRGPSPPPGGDNRGIAGIDRPPGPRAPGGTPPRRARTRRPARRWA